MKLDRQELVFAAMLFFVALGISVLFADRRYAFEPDGARWLNAARNLAAGETSFGGVIRERSGIPSPKSNSDFTKPPLFGLLLALFVKLGMDARVAGWMISQVSFAIAASALYGLGRFALPRLPSILVALLFTVQVSGLKWSIFVREDMLFLAFTFTSLLLLVFLRERKASFLKSSWFCLGLLTAAALLTRYVGVALVVTVGGVILADFINAKRKELRPLCFYSLGLAAAGIWPFYQFVSLWWKGGRPSFYQGAEQTWFQITAGLISSLQRDFTGRIWVWLYDHSFTDEVYLILALVALGAVILLPSKMRALTPISVFVACYLLILVSVLARSGMDSFEHRYAVPVHGLLILLGTFSVWNHFVQKPFLVRVPAAIVGLFSLAMFLNGQVERYREFDSFHGAGESREWCPAPATLAWVKDNIPAGSVIIGTQCCFQLIAETNRYYWLPIPPADEYNASPRYQERWDEKDFLRARELTGAKWIVMLFGRDALAKDPGYGSFVSALMAGMETPVIRRVAAFTDGIVYSIQANPIRT